METEEQREQRMRRLDDHIGRALTESERSGELRAAPSFGKPLQFGDGFEETPEELRMGYKILKDAGVVPPEVELMREIESLRLLLADSAGDDDATRQQRERLLQLRQQLALRMERLRSTGTL